MTGQVLLDIMLRDGVPIGSEEREKVLSRLNEAVNTGHVLMIERDGGPVGFLTFRHLRGRVYVDYCFIYRVLRNRFNLLESRRLLRQRYGHLDGFYWKSRKRNRMWFVR